MTIVLVEPPRLIHSTKPVETFKSWLYGRNIDEDEVEIVLEIVVCGVC
jgi:hypothetical protein